MKNAASNRHHHICLNACQNKSMKSIDRLNMFTEKCLKTFMFPVVFYDSPALYGEFFTMRMLCQAVEICRVGVYFLPVYVLFTKAQLDMMGLDPGNLALGPKKSIFYSFSAVFN